MVGVNAYQESVASPLTAGPDGGTLAMDPGAEAEQVARLEAWRKGRDAEAAARALAGLKTAVTEGRNIMEPSIACAQAGVTTGQWADALREIFGEYRAPTGLGGPVPSNQIPSDQIRGLEAVRARVDEVSRRLGRRLKMLVGKPGLDGHSNGAEQIAVRARDSGFEVVYEGIRLTPEQIVNAALEEGVHVVGLSVLSGSHVALIGEVLAGLARVGLGDLPVVAGGIIPAADQKALRKAGVAAVYTPKDYNLTAILADIVEIVDRAKR